MKQSEAAKRARLRAGMSSGELSKRTGIAPATIYAIEHSTREYNSSIQTIKILADALGVSLDEYTGHEVVRREFDYEKICGCYKKYCMEEPTLLTALESKRWRAVLRDYKNARKPNSSYLKALGADLIGYIAYNRKGVLCFYLYTPSEKLVVPISELPMYVWIGDLVE